MYDRLWFVSALIGNIFKEKFLVRAVSAEEACYKVEKLNREQIEVNDVPLYHAESKLTTESVEWEFDVIPL